MKARLLACVLLLLSSAASAGAFKIKEFTVGMTLEEYTYSSLCEKQPDGTSECFDDHPVNTVADVGMETVTMNFGADDRARLIIITFDSKGYPAVMSALRSRYGKFNCTNKTVSNRMGAKFADQTCRKQSGNEMILVEKYTNDLTEGSVTMTTVRALVDISDKLNKKADGDL